MLRLPYVVTNYSGMNDRQNGQRGGGVLLHIKSELHPTEYKPISKFPEQVWCTIRDDRNKEYHIGVI